MLCATNTLLSQAKNNPEQEAIRKAIEGETAAIDACNYTLWADHWWPEPYCYFSVTWPDGHCSMHGWEEISAWAKKTTANCTPNTTDRRKRDYKYAVNGNMIGGFGLLAWPVRYEETGVNTFMVSHHGTIYQADLGPATESIVKYIERFNPDDDWSVVND